MTFREEIDRSVAVAIVNHNTNLKHSLTLPYTPTPRKDEFESIFDPPIMEPLPYSEPWHPKPTESPQNIPKTPAMETIKKGDKLILVTRRDISPGYQAVQSCHALRQFGAEYPDIDAEWYHVSNYLALLSVENEVELMRLITQASDLGLKWSAFREPDIGGKITAIAIEPGETSQMLCNSLPLALKIE